MKPIILSILMIMLLMSCSDDNCLEEKNKEAEKYDEMIEKAEGDDVQQRTIIRNKELRLAQFDC